MRKDDLDRIEQISKHSYVKNNETVFLITKKEKYNLMVEKGTLTKEEREVMNSHAKLSYEMLSTLPTIITLVSYCFDLLLKIGIKLFNTHFTVVFQFKLMNKNLFFMYRHVISDTKKHKV
jgi:hypothetical protein